MPRRRNRVIHILAQQENTHLWLFLKDLIVYAQQDFFQSADVVHLHVAIREIHSLIPFLPYTLRIAMPEGRCQVEHAPGRLAKQGNDKQNKGNFSYQDAVLCNASSTS